MREKTMQSLLQYGLIGFHTKVVKGTHPGYLNLEGVIIDETQNTITILHEDKRKIVPKGTSTFQFTLPSGVAVEIEGKELIGRPEERLKKKLWRKRECAT